MGDLKPCPFCGAKAQTLADPVADFDVDEHRVQCSASTKCPAMARTSWMPTLAEAVADWNQRAGETTLLAERDELREALRERMATCSFCRQSLPKKVECNMCVRNRALLERLSRHPVLQGKGTPG